MKKITWMQWAGFVVLCMAAVLLLTGLIFALYRKPIDSADVAAWVQAVGSIVAIVGAFAIANRQSEEQARTVRERTLEDAARDATLSKAAAQRVLAAVENFMELLHKYPPNTDFSYDPVLLTSAMGLVEMSLQRSLSPELTLALVGIHNELLNVIRGIGQLNNMQNPLSNSRVAMFTNQWLKEIQSGTVDVILIYTAAHERLTAFRGGA